MQHHFNTGLLILSSLVSFLSSYTAFRLFQLSAQRAGTARHWWVAASAVAIGGGAIWAMHFIAMLAVQFDGTATGHIAKDGDSFEFAPVLWSALL